MKKTTLQILAAYAGMLLFGIVMISLGTVNTFLKEQFALTNTQLGSLAALLPFGILIGSLLFGPFADRFGYKYLLTICTLLVSAGLWMMVSTGTLLTIQLAFLLIGLGGGAINGGTNAMVSDINTENKSAALSLLGVFYGIGALGMPLLTGLLVKIWTLKQIIRFIALILLIPVVYFSLIAFPPPKHSDKLPMSQIKAFFKDSILIGFGFILFFESALEGMANNWSATYLTHESIGLPNTKAVMFLTFLVAAITVGRLILGWALRKLSSVKVLYICFSLILFGAIGLYFTGSRILYSAPSVTAALSLILLGLGFSAGFPVVLAHVGERYPDLSGSAFSFVLVIALIGNTLLNYLTGIMTSSFGIQFYPLLLIISTLIMMILAYKIFKSQTTKE
ncbi:MAG: MFS transporter [Candidatus Marinimicrobia bacterium]|nr:MFS transporter [Candidatus Neomarinimicrobiota bacterium]MDD5582097.1 MFS transporter [Candidatus Neomarinimicrobiota bacterium]